MVAIPTSSGRRCSFCASPSLLFALSSGKIMLSQRIFTRRLPQLAARSTVVPRASFSQVRSLAASAELDDPLQNGGYQNPPRVKRQFRDPYAGWWDQQEKRNFGEPVHEDNEVLGVFTPEEYTHVSPGKGLFHIGCFVAVFLGLSGVVSFYYPDRPSAPRTFPDGLEKELGGPGASPARKPSQGAW